MDKCQQGNFRWALPSLPGGGSYVDKRRRDDDAGAKLLQHDENDVQLGRQVLREEDGSEDTLEELAFILLSHHRFLASCRCERDAYLGH